MNVDRFGPMWRGLFWVAALLLCATAEAASQIRKESDLHARLAKQPLTFFVAQGSEDACGPGCSTWIAVQGQFDKGSAARFAAFIDRTKSKHLPVFLSSTGGLTDEGIEFGRFLRSNAMHAGIATSKADCAQPRSAACRAKMAAGRPISATWDSRDAVCSSACVFALLGATARSVPPDVKIGVHSTAYFCFREDGRVMRPVGKSKDAVDCRKKLGARVRQLDRYIAEMGISTEFIRAMNSVPNSRIRFLTRDEIRRFGIANDEPPAS